jgi:pimeloyl-ACP methyl ester carboxylesterase
VSTRSITTAKGITCDVEVFDGGGDAVLAFHGVGGHLGGEPALAALAERGHTVYAPVWPGFGDDPGEGLLEDMLDFALHGADVGVALGLDRPHLYGHSFGGMIAAEMAALAPALYGGVGLVSPAGLWLDDHPIVDIYTLLPYEFPGVLLHDPEADASLLTGGVDFEDPAALTAFLIGNSRRLGTAGKILFPIPNRRLSKRLYRVTNRVELVWGASDALIPPVYASRWQELLTSTTTHLTIIDEAAHLAPYEQPEAVADALAATYGAA